jgi:hypothetical protein
LAKFKAHFFKIFLTFLFMIFPFFVWNII